MRTLLISYLFSALVLLVLLSTMALPAEAVFRRPKPTPSNPAPVDSKRKTLNEASRSKSASLSIMIDEPHEDMIRCAVCERAIEHIWDKGAQLRSHCKGDGTDPRCDFSNMHSFGIEEMASAVCEDLPETHQAFAGSEFELILAEYPEHPRSVAKAISRACRRWLHEQHGAEKIALYIYSNLDAGKAKGTILHSLQHRFCKNACNPSYKLPGDAHDKTHYDEL